MAGLAVAGLAALRARLEALRVEAVMAAALARGAEGMAEGVRAGLAEVPGAAHERPWVRSGALRDSVGVVSEGLVAVVGSSDVAAVPQEMGTRVVPARPFLAPVGAAMGEGVANGVGAAVAAAIRGGGGDGLD